MRLEITRIAPGSTVQDEGRPGALKYGLSRSGPMDRLSYAHAACGGEGAIEFTMSGLEARVLEGSGKCRIAGPGFTLHINDESQSATAPMPVSKGDTLAVPHNPSAVYGYLRFSGDLDVPLVLGSRATNLVAGVGGVDGRALRAGDVLTISNGKAGNGPSPSPRDATDGPIRILPGLHADQLGGELWSRFCATSFRISSRLDRMGVRLDDAAAIFAGGISLGLVSDAVVPGDIQILGDGTPVVLMRDHQPTGGYPRVATIIDADLDRFAQLVPGSAVAFHPVGLAAARAATIA